MTIIEIKEYPPGETVDGRGTLRVDLDIEVLYDKTAIVIHKDTGILCVKYRDKYSYKLYEPVKFNDAQKAQKWIESGNIGRLQENFSELDVGFKKEMIVYREPSDYEKMIFGE